jgi:hypothetical protein
MKQYIFIAPETLTYKPNLDRPEPDFVDMQLIGVSHDDMFQDALQDLIEMNGSSTGDMLAYNIRFDKSTQNLKYFSFKPRRSKIPLAS